jgi:hypothetical protein
LIRAYPVFGCALDAYKTAFSRFKISGPLVTDDFVYNEYPQLLAELELAGFVIGAALAFSVVRMALRDTVKSSDPEPRYFALACVGALSTFALHSLVDFNLYIPATVMLLAWIARMTVAVGSRESTIHGWERLEQPNVTAGGATSCKTAGLSADALICVLTRSAAKNLLKAKRDKKGC